MKKLYLLLLASLILPLLLLASVSALIEVDSCKELNITNEVYILNASILTNGTGECIQIKANNITFNLNGYNLTSNYSGYGIDIYNNNSRIYNGSIFNFSSGMYFESSSFYNVIDNMIINFNYASGISSRTNINISNVISKDNFRGFTLYSNSNINNITFINITDDSLLLTADVENITLNNIYIDTYYDQSNDGTIYTIGSKKNIIFSNSIFNTNNSILINIRSGSINNYFINCTYNTSKENITGTGTLIRQWYYQAFINSSSGLLLSNTNITVFNNIGTYQINLTSDILGFTQRSVLTDYISTSTDRNYSSPYNIYASVTSYSSTSHILNVTEVRNYLDTFTLTLAPISYVPVIPVEDGLTRGTLAILCGILAIIVLAVSLGCIKFIQDINELSVEDFLKYAIGLVIALALISILFSAIGGLM